MIQSSFLLCFLGALVSDCGVAATSQRYQWKTHDQNLDPLHSVRTGQWHISGSSLQQDERYDRYTNSELPFKVKLVQGQKPYNQRSPQAGTLWKNNTNYLTEWETTTSFSIANVNEGATLTANQAQNEGMAIWYADKKSPTGSFFGVEGTWTGLGLFFDSYVDRVGDVRKLKGRREGDNPH
jgi:hypothetical protein